MLLPDQESHRFANLMDKMESELNKKERERGTEIKREKEVKEFQCGVKYLQGIYWQIGNFNKIIDLNN